MLIIIFLSTAAAKLIASIRTRGHDFELPIIKYEFNKRYFIVQSLLNYV